MPVFKLDTNVSVEKITPQFISSTSKLIAKALGKPEQYVCVHVNADQKMLFGGSDKPCGFASLLSIGQIGKDVNKKHSMAISEHLEQCLSISSDRLYIHFVDAPGYSIGYGGSTF